VTGYGAAARHGLVLSLRRFKQTRPSHPHTLRQKSTGSSRAWRSPFLSFVSFLRVWRLTCLNASQSAPQIYRPAHHTSGTPARPIPANKSAGSPSVPRRLKPPAPQAPPFPPHARPRMSGTLILQTVSTSWLLLPHDHDHDLKPHPKSSVYFWIKRVREEQRNCASASTSLGRHIDRYLLADLGDRGMRGINIL
jgi:hypothetical protein